MSAPTFGSDTDMQYVDSNIQHDDDVFGGMTFEQSSEPMQDDDEEDESPDAQQESGYDEFLSSDQPEVDARFIKAKPRPARAKQYERKTAGLFAVGVKLTVQSPRTIADSAAMLVYGPTISEKVGDLAAENAMVARAVDMLTDQTENATIALIMAATPFALQVLRNHEKDVHKETQARASIRIPFTKREIRLRFRVRLPRRMRNMTQEPKQLVGRVFTNPEIVEAMRKQGINLVNE